MSPLRPKTKCPFYASSVHGEPVLVEAAKRFKSIFINRNLLSFRYLDTHISLKLKFVN